MNIKLLLSAAFVVTSSIGNIASAGLADDYDGIQNERQERIDRCFVIYDKAQYNASMRPAAAGTGDRIYIAPDGTITAIVANNYARNNYSRVQCDDYYLGQLNVVKDEFYNDGRKYHSQFLLEGTTLVKYVKFSPTHIVKYNFGVPLRNF